MYYLIFIMLMFLVFYEILAKKISKKYFTAFFIFLTVVLMFRYGQGTDYFGYRLSYDRFALDFSNIFRNFITGESYKNEPMYDILVYSFKALNASFETFVMFVSLFQMRCLYKFIVGFTKYRFVALFIFYTNYWHIFDSAFRQGIAIAIILGYTASYIYEGKKFKAAISIIIASLIHTSAIILIVALFIQKEKTYNIKWVIVLSLIAFAIAFTNIPLRITQLLPLNIEDRVSAYISKDGGSIIALINRITVLGLIIVMLKVLRSSVSKDITMDEFGIMSINLFFWGFVIYCMTFKSSLIASRVSIYFKSIEIIIIPRLFEEIRKVKLAKGQVVITDYKHKILSFYLVIMLIFSINWFKNIDSWIQQGQYKDGNIFDYEYVSIFNKDRIYEIRKRGLL